jgi:hypothetical protein
MRLIMPTLVSTEFTAQPLTYFVRSLGLKSSFHLTTGTFNQIVKDQSRTPPERLVLDFRLPDPLFKDDRLVLETCCLLAASATRDEPFNISAIRCCPSTHIPHLVDAFDSASPTRIGAILLNSARCSGIVWHNRPRLRSGQLLTPAVSCFCAASCCLPYQEAKS